MQSSRLQRYLKRPRIDAPLGGALALLAACLAAGDVAAQPNPDSANEAAPSLQALRIARDRLAEARDFEAALGPARSAVEAQRQSADEDYADDLAALVRIEAELRDVDTVVDRYLEVADVIAAEQGRSSPALIDVYHGLGRAYIRGERYTEAIAALGEARELSRRNFGLFNVQQSTLIDDLTTAHLRLGDTVAARRLQLERLDNAIRRFGADDPRVVPYRYALADYYRRSRLPDSAREQYDAAVRTEEAAHGETSATLLAPLRELVKLDMLVGQGADRARRDRLAALLECNGDADPVERGLSLAVLGDWAIVRNEPLGARDYYRRAWSTLASSTGFDVAAYFATPVMLDFVAPLSAVDRAQRRRPYTWGEIVVELDVGADGRPASVRVAGNETGPLHDLYRRRVRETHFRPRLVAGEPVATTNLQSRHYFRYYVERGDDE